MQNRQTQEIVEADSDYDYFYAEDLFPLKPEVNKKVEEDRSD